MIKLRKQIPVENFVIIDFGGVVRDKLSGKHYVIQLYPENTAEDMIKALIQSQLIPSTSRRKWRLADSMMYQLPPDVRVVEWLSQTRSKGGIMAHGRLY